METESKMETPLPENSQAAAPENGGRGNVAGIAAAVAAEHGHDAGNAGNQNVAQPSAPVVKKKGRPVLHGLYSKLMGSNGKNPVRPVPGQSPLEVDKVPARVEIASLIPEDLQRSIIKETICFGENWGLAKIEGKAAKCGLTPVEISAELKGVALSPEKKDALARLAPLACKEAGFDLNLSPIAGIVLLLTPNALAGFTAFSTLTKLAEERVRNITEGSKEKEKQ